MPELPEVQTTVNGLNKKVRGWTISDVWTDYNSPHHAGKDNIKNPKFFAKFKAAVVDAKIIGARRRAKNVLIDLIPAKTGAKTETVSAQTILIHMKMTGHIMCGEYVFDPKIAKTTKRNAWKPANKDPKNPLNDPFNRFIHLVFTLGKTGGEVSVKHLVLSDMRKFGKVTLLPTEETLYGKEKHAELTHLGPEPLDEKFTFDVFDLQLSKRAHWPIKQALMDQTLIAGVGNIYSDEILWRASVHPKSRYGKTPLPVRKDMYKATKEMLRKGIDFGGDSMSDYRNIDGLPGEFQGQHQAYRRTSKPCNMKVIYSGKRITCKGIIGRMIIGGRSAHFCDRHQMLFS
jgi:formamidopyrimidine-DNA glycosylase